MLSAVLALSGGRAFAEHRHAGKRGHGRGIAALGRPVAELVLVVGEIVEAFADDLARARIVDGSPCAEECKTATPHTSMLRSVLIVGT